MKGVHGEIKNRASFELFETVAVDHLIFDPIARNIPYSVVLHQVGVHFSLCTHGTNHTKSNESVVSRLGGARWMLYHGTPVGRGGDCLSGRRRLYRLRHFWSVSHVEMVGVLCILCGLC